MGDSYLADNLQYRGVLWSATGTPQNLGLLGFNGSTASAFNNSATVVGRATSISSFIDAVAWRDAQLDDLVAGSPSYITGASAVSDSGRIVGFAGSYGVVWGPGAAG